MKKVGKPTTSSESLSFTLSVFTRYAHQVKGFFGKRLKQPWDVDDLAQEVYLRLLRVDPNRIQKTLPYILGIANHVLTNHLQAESEQQRCLPSAGEAVEVLEDQPSEVLGDRLDDCLSVRQEILEALKGLSPTHGSVLVLFQRDEMSYAEIAERLQISVHTVKIYLRAARRQLRLTHWSDE